MKKGTKLTIKNKRGRPRKKIKGIIIESGINDISLDKEFFIGEHPNCKIKCVDLHNDLSSDPVNHPKHYCAHPSGVECITVTEHMNFNVGNAIKYLWRTDHKNGIEDLKKARWYVDREIERLKNVHK